MTNVQVKMAASLVPLARSTSKSPSSISPGDLEALPEPDYDPWLLDDHPLRSYPRECFPGLSMYLPSWYIAAKKNWNERVFRVICVLLMILGVVQCIAVVSNGFMYLLPGGYDWKMDGWDELQRGPPDTPRWPAEFKGEGKSIECIAQHTRSHADPFHFAIASGCTGVKADIWLHDNDILVGSSVPGLDAANTLSHLYLDPLLKTLKDHNDVGMSNGKGEQSPSRGVFADDTSKSFILLLDFKTTPNWLWARLVSQLDSLRAMDFLTHYSGSEIVQRPVTIVVTGRAPFDFIRASRTSRDIFFDASLEELALNDSESLSKFAKPLSSIKRSEIEGSTHVPDNTAASTDGDARRSETSDHHKNTVYTYNSENSYSASANFRESIGFPQRGKFSRRQIEMIRAHVRAAHNRGLKARYDGIPNWPGKLRDLVWRTLVYEGVDIIDVHWSPDQPRGRGGWRRPLAIGDKRGPTKDNLSDPGRCEVSSRGPVGFLLSTRPCTAYV